MLRHPIIVEFRLAKPEKAQHTKMYVRISRASITTKQPYETALFFIALVLLLGYPLSVLHGILVVRIGEGVGECPTELTVCLISIVCRVH